MPKVLDGYYITKPALIRFKKWLVENDLTVNRFSRYCGCSRQYIEKVLKGKAKITAQVLEKFRKGGYNYL